MAAVTGTHTESKQPQSTPTTLRVVSLLGAATETMYRLGVGHYLVGRSHECDYPRAALSLPCISRPRLDVDASSADIDATVREHSAAGEPIYKLDDEVLQSLNPDLLIAQDHCRVCAVTPRDVGKSSCANVKQLVLKPATLGDCILNVIMIANALGVPQRGLLLQKTMISRMDRVKQLATGSLNDSSTDDSTDDKRRKPRVALLEWCDPIMGCGYWLPELVEVAGGEALHCPPPGELAALLHDPTIHYI
jgi:iron complex transport system substrate-binding protein